MRPVCCPCLSCLSWRLFCVVLVWCSRLAVVLRLAYVKKRREPGRKLCPFALCAFCALCVVRLLRSRLGVLFAFLGGCMCARLAGGIRASRPGLSLNGARAPTRLLVGRVVAFGVRRACVVLVLVVCFFFP